MVMVGALLRRPGVGESLPWLEGIESDMVVAVCLLQELLCVYVEVK
jgi:hypothetical protein